MLVTDVDASILISVSLLFSDHVVIIRRFYSIRVAFKQDFNLFSSLLFLYNLKFTKVKCLPDAHIILCKISSHSNKIQKFSAHFKFHNGKF